MVPVPDLLMFPFTLITLPAKLVPDPKFTALVVVEVMLKFPFTVTIPAAVVELASKFN